MLPCWYRHRTQSHTSVLTSTGPSTLNQTPHPFHVLALYHPCVVVPAVGRPDMVHAAGLPRETHPTRQVLWSTTQHCDTPALCVCVCVALISGTAMKLMLQGAISKPSWLRCGLSSTAHRPSSHCPFQIPAKRCVCQAIVRKGSWCEALAKWPCSGAHTTSATSDLCLHALCSYLLTHTGLLRGTHTGMLGLGLLSACYHTLSSGLFVQERSKSTHWSGGAGFD